MTHLTQSHLDDSTQISDGLEGSPDAESLGDLELDDMLDTLVRRTRRGITITHPESYGYVRQILTQYLKTTKGLKQETKDKITDAIAQMDSTESIDQLKEVTRELEIGIHFGGPHITVYKELCQEEEYQSIFASLMTQLDQQSQLSQDTQTTQPWKQRSKGSKTTQTKYDQSTPTAHLSQVMEELTAQTETNTVQTDPTSLGGNTRQSITTGDTQPVSDFTTLQQTIHKLVERQGRTEQHQQKFKREIKPIIENNKEEVAELKQKIHQLLTDQKATSEQQMEYNEHLIHNLFATKYTMNP